MFLFAVLERYALQSQYKNYWCIKLIGIIAGVILIPVMYYTYNGAFGPSPDWVNIAMFFIAAAFTYFLETKLFESGKISCKKPLAAFLVLCLIALVFAELTFVPPNIPIFEDPVTKI